MNKGLFLVVLTLMVQGAFAQMKMGVFDIQTVVDAIDDGKKARTDIEKAMQLKKERIKELESSYSKLESEYENQKLVLTPKVLETKRKELDVKKMELQRNAYDAQMDMQKMEMELRGSITKKIQTVVEKIGQAGGFNMILEKTEAGIVYATNTMDLTQKVIQEYSKTYAKK